jgi:hypothetical protein
MKILLKELRLSEEDFYCKHFELVGLILDNPLSSMQNKILSQFVIESTNGKKKDIFNTISRKKVKEKFKLSDAGLSGYIKSLIEKGYIQKDKSTEKVYIHEKLLPDNQLQGYKLKLISMKK